MKAVLRRFVLIGLGLCLVQVSRSSAEEPEAKPALEPGKIVQRTYFFKEADKDMEYSLFVPKGYDKSKKYPLVVALHGLGATPRIMLGYPGLTKLAQKGGYIVVAPMGYNTRGWYGVWGQRSRRWKPENLGELSEKDVLNVLGIVEKEFNIDPDRVYLMGHSMGGGGTWHIAMKYPEKWAALGPIAPAIFRAPRDLEKIKHIPVILVQGDKDTLVPVDRAREWAKKMDELKMTHKYIEVKDGGHVAPAFQKLPDIFEFFDKHKRQSPLD